MGRSGVIFWDAASDIESALTETKALAQGLDDNKLTSKDMKKLKESIIKHINNARDCFECI